MTDPWTGGEPDPNARQWGEPPPPPPRPISTGKGLFGLGVGATIAIVLGLVVVGTFVALFVLMMWVSMQSSK